MKRPKKARAELLASQSHPVPMAVAASLVYHHLNRDIGKPGVDAGYDGALNSTALALSQVADIYHVQYGKVLRIPSEELAQGRFEARGATYRAASGRIYLE